MKAFEKLSFQVSLFLLLAGIITLLCGLVFITGQQIYRQSAYDPQIQLSEDMAEYLSKGQDINQVMPKSDVEISKSQVWFIMDFDDAGKVKASNAKLDGQTPVVPAGALDHAKQNGQNRVTWQPRDGVRIATVITKYNGGEILVGRSLRETESRIKMLGARVLVAWLVTIIAAFIGTWFLFPNLKKHH